MHQIGVAGSSLTRIHFGFSPSHLFLRLDGRRAVADLMAEGYAFALTVLQPAKHRLDIRPSGEVIWATGPRHVVRVAAATVLELAVPIVELDARPGAHLAFFVSAIGPAGGPADTERYPVHRPIQVVVPGAGFAGDNWRA